MLIEPAYGWGSVVKSSARVSSLGFDLFPTPLPPQDAQPSQAGAEEEERGRLGNWVAASVDVHRPGKASAASLAAEDVGHEDVPKSVRGFQLRERRIGNGKMEIIDVRSGSAIAARINGAKDRGGPKPGAVGLERSQIGRSGEAPRDGHGRSVQRGGAVRDCRASHGVVEYKE